MAITLGSTARPENRRFLSTGVPRCRLGAKPIDEVVRGAWRADNADQRNSFGGFLSV
jgi:hypothetical protein